MVDSLKMIKNKMKLILIIFNFSILLAQQTQHTNNNGIESDSNEIYLSEFEIIDMLNFDGHLQNGQCCNGQSPTIINNNSFCKGGNTTCVPYWRICIAELEPDFIATLNREELIDSKPMTTTKKPSIISNLFSKIFKTKSNQSSSTQTQHQSIKDIVNNLSIQNCPIGYWSSPIINIDTAFPISMKKLINMKLLSKYRSNALLLSRNFIVIIEILSRNSNRNKNRIISKQINYYNLNYDEALVANKQLTDEWFYGGFIDNINNNLSLKINDKRQKFQYHYRWRLKSLNYLRDDSDMDQDLINELNISINNINLNGNNNICPTGYTGDDCNKPICLDGCHPEHGYCEQPGQCSCRFGWTGMHCQHCLTLPGCVHGTCSRPFECRCEPQWTGMFCSIPECKIGCHPQNGYCTKPGECKCKFGWQGENCTECSTLPGCQHGTCNDPLDCNCNEGWQGTFCSTPICSIGCRHGWCENPNECRCKIGYRGVNCSECVPYPGCQHGDCLNNEPWTCNCFNGFGGILCDERLDWCERQTNMQNISNINNETINQLTIDNQSETTTTTTAIMNTKHVEICLNGGTCISMTHSQGDYRCHCLHGFTGKHCEHIV